MLEEAGVGFDVVEKGAVDVEYIDIVSFGSPVPRSSVLTKKKKKSNDFTHGLNLRRKDGSMLVNAQCPQHVFCRGHGVERGVLADVP